jgi:deoxyribose-phosphate aldolase
MSSQTVALASDHGGFALKTSLVRHLQGKGVRVVDVGTNSTEAVDYPVFARKAAEAVANGGCTLGIIVDGAGIGSCMVANKVKGVRAGMAFDVATAKNAREHNDANVLTLGAGYLDEAAAKAIVDVFISTECTVDRHKKRVAMIDALDGGMPNQKRGAPMAADDSALVEQITRALMKNPALLASLTGSGGGGGYGGAPGNVCMTCNDCKQNCASQAPDAVRGMVASHGAMRVSSNLGVSAVPADLAKLIDHTLLKPESTYKEIDQLCAEARQYGFMSVCVNPIHVKRCAKNLAGSSVLVCTVVGFPLGATHREIKALEARRAVREGAREIDMVLNIGALKSGDQETVYEDIALVREAAHDGGAILKVILETALLTDEEKAIACILSKKARADFVKTSTGMSKGGATAHDIALMAKAVDHKLGVKASGGVKSAADAKTMIEAGATRIGASVGIQIVKEASGQLKPGSGKSAGY